MSLRRLPGARFTEKIQVHEGTGCHEWTGYTDAHTGYAQFWWHGHFVRAHRWWWQWHFGTLPKDQFVCHKCDNKKCVNLEHLFVGTARDNARDMAKKGRARFGYKTNFSKLSEAEVVTIKAVFGLFPKCRFLRMEMSNIFKVRPVTISTIRDRNSWDKIGDELSAKITLAFSTNATTI